jgi:hypothetical protein
MKIEIEFHFKMFNTTFFDLSRDVLGYWPVIGKILKGKTYLIVLQILPMLDNNCLVAIP